ncbi:MAG TPA: DMT family transporter [Candidatus Babeliales bacterium]|nr:DMT family transporter [Candidatus Babeliales bacterium]
MTFIVLLQALFATSFPIGKYLLSFASPLFLSGSRMLIAGGILLIYQYCLPRTKLNFQGKHHFWIFAQIIVLGMYITYGLRLYALDALPVWKTSFFYNFSPFLSALYAYFLFNERLSIKQWCGLSIGLIGMIPILISSSPAEATLGEFFFISKYEMFLMLSVSLHCYSWILIQKLVRHKDYDTSVVNGICMASGGLLSLITSYAIEGPAPLYNPIAFSKGLIVMVFISNILCHNIYAKLLKTYSATFMSFTSFLSPLFAALYGWAFFQETISWHFYLSIIIVLIGLYTFYQDELKNKSNYKEKIIRI